MKRLLGLTGLTCFAVLTACFYLSNVTALIIGCGGLILLVASLCIPSVRREGTFPVVFLTSLCSALIFLVFTYSAVIPVQSTYNGVTAEVRATQKSEAYHAYGYYCYELDVISIDGDEVNTGLLLRTQEAVFSEPYDELTFTCELSTDVNETYLSKGIYLQAFLFDEPDVNISSLEQKPFMYHVIGLREDLRRALYLEVDADTADFSSALLLGDKYAIDVEVKELLRICGLSHISVVSGLHLSIIAAVFSKLTAYIFKRNRYIPSILTILVVIGFVLLTGFGIPVIRSAVMLIIFTVGKLINREADSMNSIGAAALLICFMNPYSVGDVGMLLSFSATMGIVMWCDKIAASIMNRLERISFFNISFINKVCRYIVYCLSCSLSAILWTLPIGIIVFGGFSSVGLLANLLVVPLINIALDLVILCVILHFIPFLSILTDICAFGVELYYKYLIFICEWLSQLPAAYVDADKPYFYLWLAATLVLIAVAVLVKTKTAYRITIVFSVLILLFGSARYHISMQNTVTLYVPDTGNDLSVILESSDGHAVVNCGGSRTKSYVLNNMLSDLTSGDRDILVISPNAYFELYSKNILNEFDYPHILRYDSSIGTDVTEMQVSDTETLFGGDFKLELWGKATVTYISLNDTVYEYITVGDTDVLVLPKDGDCNDLDSIYRTPDIIITERVVKNMGLLSCDTLIIPGEDYMAKASLEIAAPIAENVITGKDIAYDIQIN